MTQAAPDGGRALPGQVGRGPEDQVTQPWTTRHHYDEHALKPAPH